MRRRVGVALMVAGVVGLLLGLTPQPAGACSCAAPEPGTPVPEAIVNGLVVEGSRFFVEEVERGPVQPGEEITVNVIRGDEAGCGVDVDRLDAGRRYRLGGSYDEERRTLHLNLCSSPFAEPLSGAPPTTSAPVTTDTVGPPQTTTAESPTTEGREGTLVAVIDDGDAGGVSGWGVAAGAIAVSGAGVAGVALWRRRSGGLT